MLKSFTVKAVRTHREDGTPLEIPELPEMPDNVERVEYFGTGMKPEDMGDADNYLTHYEYGAFKQWNRLATLDNSENIYKDPTGEDGIYYARVWYKKEKPAPTEPLPQIEGWRFDLSKGKWGMTWDEVKAIKCDSMTVYCAGSYRGVMSLDNWAYGGKDDFYVPAYKIPKKTELADLIGDDHQRVAYLIHHTDGISRQFIPMIKHGQWRDWKSDRASLKIHYRYAHSLNTEYEDANHFIF